MTSASIRRIGPRIATIITLSVVARIIYTAWFHRHHEGPWSVPVHPVEAMLDQAFQLADTFLVGGIFLWQLLSIDLHDDTPTRP